jgi:hypothetical protein
MLIKIKPVEKRIEIIMLGHPGKRSKKIYLINTDNPAMKEKKDKTNPK